MKTFIKNIILGLEKLVSVPDLLLRLWIAKIFFNAGLTKKAPGLLPVPSDTTFLLFEYEYSVPIISPQIAAYAGTLTELIVPIFLAIGLGGRFAAGILFIFNIVAVISYPGLEPAAVTQHTLWGLILLYLTLRGPGKLSIDHLIRRKHMPNYLPKP